MSSIKMDYPNSFPNVSIFEMNIAVVSTVFYLTAHGFFYSWAFLKHSVRMTEMILQSIEMLTQLPIFLAVTDSHLHIVK